jgi:hypothetical protein
MLLEIFEPAISGFIMALALAVIDLITGVATKHSLRYHFFEGAVEHATPFAFFVSILGIGASLMMTGGVLAGPTRTILVAPLLRLSHHVSMVAFGVLLACAWNMVSPNGLITAVAVAWAAVMLAALGVYSFMAQMLVSSTHLSDLEAYRSFRWLAFAVGLVACIGSGLSLSDLAAKHEAKQETHECAEAASSPASGPASSAH